MADTPTEYRRRTAPLGCALAVLASLVAAGAAGGSILIARGLAEGRDSAVSGIALLCVAGFAAFLAGTLTRRWTVLTVDRTGLSFQAPIGRKEHLPWDTVAAAGTAARRLAGEESWWLAVQVEEPSRRPPVRGARRWPPAPHWWLVAELDAAQDPRHGLAQSVRRRVGERWRGTLDPLS